MWQVFVKVGDDNDLVKHIAYEPMSYADALVVYTAHVKQHPEDHVVIRKAVQ
jgi:hypothetical protein